MKKIFLILLLLISFSCNNDPMKKILNRNNELSGSMIDKSTKFIKVYTVDINFYYEYSLNICKIEQNEFANKVIEKTISNTLKLKINSVEEFKIIAENGYNIIFKYNCDDGRKIAEINFEYINGNFKYIRQESIWNESVDLMFEGLNSQK